jgi:hypothetical protein
MNSTRQEVESKIHGVIADVTVLKQQAVKMQMDKDEQAKIIKRKNRVIICGRLEPESDSKDKKRLMRTELLKCFIYSDVIRYDEISISNCIRRDRKQTD